MRSKLYQSALTAILVAVLSTAALAAAPRLINYQGRVLTAAGAPVTNGPHTFDFRIYPTPAGGAVSWLELGVAIATTNGLFTYALGSPTAFPNNLFIDLQELWLEVTVDGQLQTPRTRFISNPYAETAGNLSLENPSAPGAYSYRTDPGSNGFSTYGDDGKEQIRLWGLSWGEILLYDGDPTNDITVQLRANPSGGGMLSLTDDGGIPTIVLHGGQTGNNSVYLPTDAIDADEMFNEPAVAHAFKFDGSGALSTVDSLIDSLVVNVPSSGYLWVTATGWFLVSHTSGFGETVRAWVDNAKPLNFDNFTFYNVPALAATGSYYGSISINYVEAVSAGQTVIYYMADGGTNPANSQVDRAHLNAIFLPTNCGVVEATRVGTTGDNEIASADGKNLTPAEIIDISEKVRQEFKVELEALKAENKRLNDEQKSQAEELQRVTPNSSNNK